MLTRPSLPENTMRDPDDCPHADRLRPRTDAGDEGPVTGPLDRELSPEAATEALAASLGRVLGDLHRQGRVSFIHAQTPESLAKAKAAQQAERRKAIQDLLPEAARELDRQNLQDSAVASEIAKLILQAEVADAGVRHAIWDHFPITERQATLKDAAVSLRLRRAVWRRLAIRQVQQALLDGLNTYAGRLPEAQRQCIASSLSGILFNAAVETLSGRAQVDLAEWTAAWMPLDSKP